MNKGFRAYLIVWVILLAVFQVICFVTPNRLAGYTKLDATFWIAWALITLAFVGQLVCAWFTFKAENLRRLFYNMPLLTISYTALVLMLICGAIAVAIPNLPAWVGAVICLVILGFTAVAVIKASAAAEIVERVDGRIVRKLDFMKMLSAEADSYLTHPENPEIGSVFKKVREAIRYSDPMSSENLADIEDRIRNGMETLKDRINSGDSEAVIQSGEELLQLIEERNKLCKLSK